jgi:hypothetical protein
MRSGAREALHNERAPNEGLSRATKVSSAGVAQEREPGGVQAQDAGAETWARVRAIGVLSFPQGTSQWKLKLRRPVDCEGTFAQWGCFPHTGFPLH